MEEGGGRMEFLVLFSCCWLATGIPYLGSRAPEMSSRTERSKADPTIQTMCLCLCVCVYVCLCVYLYVCVCDCVCMCVCV